jgi:hypothetical protein
LLFFRYAREVIALFPLRAGRPAERAGFMRFVRFYALCALRFFLVFSFFR